jgi:hypothetical protein
MFLLSLFSGKSQSFFKISSVILSYGPFDCELAEGKANGQIELDK